MNHLMIDFETLDNKPTSVVLSVGLVLFNKYNILASNYFDFEIKGQMENGRTISADTLMWWLNQTSGRKFTPPAEHYSTTLGKIIYWIQNMVDAHGKFENVWANDPDFDCAILEDLIPLSIPYKYYHKRSLRTFIQYVGGGVKVSRTEGQQHNALVDAIDQAKYVMERLV
jgi:exodeoxyribonuclease VIII